MRPTVPFRFCFAPLAKLWDKIQSKKPAFEAGIFNPADHFYLRKCFFHTEHRITPRRYLSPSDCLRVCSKCPPYHRKLAKAKSDSDIEEQRPKPEPVHKVSLPHVHFHIHTQFQQQNPPEQFEETTTVVKKQHTSSGSLTRIKEDDTEGGVSPLDTTALYKTPFLCFFFFKSI